MTGANRRRSTFRPKNATGSARGKTTLLTDAQWAEIARDSGLPPEAKPSVIGAIDTYRIHQAEFDNRNTPSYVRAELDDLRKDAEALAQRLARGLDDIDFWSAIFLSRIPPAGWPPRTGPMAQAVAEERMDSVFHGLQRLIDWLTLAHNRVRRVKPGAKRQSAPASAAIFVLDQILTKYTGKNLERSTKRKDSSKYVTTVLRIADPTIGVGTISEAIKNEINYRKKRGGIALQNADAVSPPNLRDRRRTVRKAAKRTIRKK